MSDSHGGYPPGSAHSPLPRHPDVGHDGNFPPPGTTQRQVLTVVIGAVLGALAWAAWLGWDHKASYDSVSGQVQDPYVTVQVTGCVLTLAAVTAVLAALSRRPVQAATGVSLGFWVLWTVTAALGDDSGLWLVGSVMVAFGLIIGTGIAALVGVGLRFSIEAVQRRSGNRRAARGGL